MAEKSILAYFNSPAEAESCVAKLRALRAIDIQVSRLGEFSGGSPGVSLNTVSESGFPGLSYLTLGLPPMERDASVLLTADVDASGMSDGSRELMTEGPGRDTLLTVVLDEAAYEQALRVIHDAGGTP